LAAALRYIDKAGNVRETHHDGGNQEPPASAFTDEHERLIIANDGNMCGPMTIGLVFYPGSGSLDMEMTSETYFFTLTGSYVAKIWSQLYGGLELSPAEMLRGEFASLLIDIRECETINPGCSLRSTIPGGWPTYKNNIVQSKYALDMPCNGCSDAAFVVLNWHYLEMKR